MPSKPPREPAPPDAGADADAGPDLARGRPGPLIWRLALPAIIGLSANALYHTVNAMFLGRLGAEAISAVSGVFPILVLLGALGEGVAVGTASFASRLLGARDAETANRAATTGLVLAILIGLCVSLALYPHIEDVLRLFGVTEAAMPLAHAYLRVSLLGYTLLMMQIFGDFLAISEGNTRFSMWVLIAAFGLNAALDPLFIFGFGWGVPGAAAATLCAQALAAAVYTGYFIRGLGKLRIAPRYLLAPRPHRAASQSCASSAAATRGGPLPLSVGEGTGPAGDLEAPAPAGSAAEGGRRRPYLSPAILAEIAAVGIPATLASSLTALAFALVYGTAGRYGDEAVAGIGIALRLFSLGALPVFGFCLGARPVLGFAWGAGDRGRVRASLRFMLGVTFAACAAYALAILAFAPAILTLFTDDAEVAAIGVRAAYACFALFALFGMHVVLVTFLQSTGQALLASVMLLAPQGYFLLPWLLALPPLWGIDGVLASQVLATGLTAGLSAFVLVRQWRALDAGTAPAPLARESPVALG